jgi:trimeric intracellular cation channel
MKIFIIDPKQLIRGIWVPSHSEILRPSFTTKACVIASVLLTVDKNTNYVNLPHEITYLVRYDCPTLMKMFSSR